MCDLCETVTTGKLIDGRCIVKLDEYTYELQMWKSKDEYGSIYELFATTEIKYCPECGNKFRDFTLEDLNFSVKTYHCLKMSGINWLSELQKKTYNDLIQIRNLSQSNIIEIQETLKHC